MLSAAKQMLESLSPSISLKKSGSAASGSKSRILPSRASAASTPHRTPGTDKFLSMLEDAEVEDEKTLSVIKFGDFATPVLHRSRPSEMVSPPGAPALRTKSESRMSHAVEFLEHCAKTTIWAAMMAWNAPVEMAKATVSASKAAVVSASKAAVAVATDALKRSKEVKPATAALPASSKEEGTQKKTAQRPAVKTKKKAAGTATKAADKENVKPGAAKAAKTATKPKGLQPQANKENAKAAAAKQQQAGDGGAPKSPRARAAEQFDAKHKPKAGGKRSGVSDPLALHGLKTQGPIAAGAFSTIVRATSLHTPGRQVAVKSFDNVKCKKDYQHLYLRNGELGALRAVKEHGPSKFVANMIEEHTGPTHTYAILEYCAGGSLMRYLQKLTTKGRDRDGNLMAIPEADCSIMAAQINAALLHLHNLDVAHRDLKPGNVLFAGDKWLKLCDFGFAKRCRGNRCHTICGTPIYMAPELTVGESKKGYLGHPVDMWAFGAMLYEMLHNKVAFNGVSEQQLHQRIQSGKTAPIRKDLSKELTSLLKELLEVKPSKRITSEKASKSKWFAPIEMTARTARVPTVDGHDA